jgi:peptidoglycan hydrolase-like protein with peptidoglycan-binding domain
LRITTFAVTLTLFAAGVLLAQDNSGGQKRPAAKKSAGRRRVAPKSASKATVKTAAVRRRSSKAKTAPKVVAARRSTQREPTPDRYKEIQQALAEKGYFRGDPDGNWGPESVEALKRFQREQNLTDDGKLGSLSLIALGLGPKRAEPAERPAQQ